MKFKSYAEFLQYLENVEKVATNGKFVDAPNKITLEKRGDCWYINGHKVVASLETMFLILRKEWLTDYSFYEEYEAYIQWKESAQTQEFERERALQKAGGILKSRNWGVAHIHRKIQWMRVHFRNSEVSEIFEHARNCK